MSLARGYNPIKGEYTDQKSSFVNTNDNILKSNEQANSKLKKSPLPISHEFDLLYAQHRSQEEVDRSDWLQKVLERHPDILELRECVNPVARATSFARLYLPSSRLIPHNTLLSLISQHFRTLGLSESQASLHSEWGATFDVPPHKLYSQLALLVQRGVHRAEKFWELSMPSIHACHDEKSTQQALDEEISKTIGAAPNINEDNQPLQKETPGDPMFIKYQDVEIKSQKEVNKPQDEENKSQEEVITYQEPVEASLNQIIYFVTTKKEYENAGVQSKLTSLTNELVNALCLTISSYASSKVFFKKICDRFDMLLDGNDVTEQMLCLKLFKCWISFSINDIEPQILDAAMQYVETRLSPRFPNRCNKIFEVTQVRKYDNEAKAVKVRLNEKCTGIWTGNFTLFDLPIDELARQLTVWSSTKYYAIKRCELLDCAWDKPRLKYRAPNVIALTTHYNNFSRWVEYSILFEEKLDERIARMEFFIQLAQELFNLNNFYDGMCVLQSFEQNSIFRLNVHKTLIRQQYQEIYKKLQDLSSLEQNYHQLRNLYKECLSKGKPALPYIGVLLSDLFKYYDGTKTFIDGLINVRKFRRIYQMISGIEEFTRDRYYFYQIEQVQAKIEEIGELDEDVLLERSALIEREGAQTKEDLPEFVEVPKKETN